MYNHQSISDVIEINATSSNGWNVSIYENGLLVTDTDSDNSYDLGSILPHDFKEVIVVVEIPSGAISGTNDLTTVWINSSNNGAISDISYVNTTVNERLIMNPNDYNRTVTAGSTYYYQFNITKMVQSTSCCASS